jgi:hypothetical protein
VFGKRRTKQKCKQEAQKGGSKAELRPCNIIMGLTDNQRRLTIKVSGRLNIVKVLKQTNRIIDFEEIDIY